MSVIQTSQLMLYREIIAVCSQIHTKHINTLCGQNVELLNVKLAVHIVSTGYHFKSLCDKKPVLFLISVQISVPFAEGYPAVYGRPLAVWP